MYCTSVLLPYRRTWMRGWIFCPRVLYCLYLGILATARLCPFPFLSCFASVTWKPLSTRSSCTSIASTVESSPLMTTWRGLSLVRVKVWNSNRSFWRYRWTTRKSATVFVVIHTVFALQTEELGQGQRMLDPPLRGVQDYGGGFHVRGRGAEGGSADSPRQFLG